MKSHFIDVCTLSAMFPFKRQVCIVQCNAVLLSPQVQFDQIHIVTGISTQGRPPGGGQFIDQYVTNYKVRYSEDCITFFTYQTEAGNADVCFSLRMKHFNTHVYKTENPTMQR